MPIIYSAGSCAVTIALKAFFDKRELPELAAEGGGAGAGGGARGWDVDSDVEMWETLQDEVENVRGGCISVNAEGNGEGAVGGVDETFRRRSEGESDFVTEVGYASAGMWHMGLVVGIWDASSEIGMRIEAMTVGVQGGKRIGK